MHTKLVFCSQNLNNIFIDEFKNYYHFLQEMKFAEKVVLSVKNDEGTGILISELLSAMDTEELRFYILLSQLYIFTKLLGCF